MLALRRGFVVGLVAFAASAAIAACSGPRGRGDAQPSASALLSNQQEGAPYPADMERLDQILAIGYGHKLPEGAYVTSVTPAVEYVKANPRGWGYVIAFTATDPAMRQYVTDTTIFSGDIIEKAPTAKSGGIQTLDLNFDDIGEPWEVGLSDGGLVLERPLGRGWLIIVGSSR